MTNRHIPMNAILVLVSIISPIIGFRWAAASPADNDTTQHRFAAAIVGYGGAGSCSLSYRFLPLEGNAKPESTRALCSCTLKLPGLGRRATGVQAVGGMLWYELASADSVVAVAKVYTGEMVLGETYTFTDTTLIPARYASAPLVPRWRLMCGHQQMLAIQCGTVVPLQR